MAKIASDALRRKDKDAHAWKAEGKQPPIFSHPVFCLDLALLPPSYSAYEWLPDFPPLLFATHLSGGRNSNLQQLHRCQAQFDFFMFLRKEIYD